MFNYYAKSADEAEYPNLWNGLVGAYVPGLLPSNTFIRSLIPGAFPATIYGATSTTWQGQRCLYFDGVDDYAQASPAGLMNTSSGGGGITISVWWAGVPPTSQFNRIIEKGANTEWHIGAHYSATNDVFAQTTGDTRLITPATYADSAWHHICYTVIWNKRAALFIDNKLTTERSDYAIAPTLSTGNIYFSRYGGGGYFSKYYLASALIYNRAMSDAEAILLYSVGPNGFATPRKRTRVFVEQAEAPATRVNFLTLLGVS